MKHTHHKIIYFVMQADYDCGDKSIGLRDNRLDLRDNLVDLRDNRLDLRDNRLELRGI